MAQNANELTLGFNSFVAYLQYRMQRLKKHYYAYVSPLKLTSELYREKLGRVPDLHHPKTFNEKVLWLKHFSDTSRWTQLADKYRVREYVEQCGLGWMLNELYAVWERPEEIDLTLPQLQGREFVLKTNNGCGDVILVSDARTADLKSIRHKMKRALRYHYGFKSAEHHYMFIKPCIIAEKMLHENPALSCSLIDYKFFCLDGEPCYCMVCYDRQGHGGFNTCLYDAHTWEPLNHYINPSHYKQGQRQIPRPASLDRMLDAARRLSHGFPEVRVDLYEIDGRPVFGELTFTSAAGTSPRFTEEFQRMMGDRITLPEEALPNRMPSGFVLFRHPERSGSEA